MVIASARAVTDSGLHSIYCEKLSFNPKCVLHRLSAKNKFLAETNKQ